MRINIFFIILLLLLSLSIAVYIFSLRDSEELEKDQTNTVQIVEKKQNNDLCGKKIYTHVVIYLQEKKVEVPLCYPQDFEGYMVKEPIIAALKKSSLSYEIKEDQKGKFLYAIEGITNNTSKKWKIYVNGQESLYRLDNQMHEPNSVIDIKFN